MSVHEPTPFRTEIPSVEADRAVKFGVGLAAAPLWATFFTAAGAGMAYWWMSAAWTRREPKSFALAKIAAQAETRSPAPVGAAEPAPGRPEPVAAPVRAPEPAPAKEAHPAPAPEPETLAAVSPVAAGLKSVVEPAEIATLAGEAEPAQTARRANGARAETPAAAPRKPPVRRKPEPKA